MRTHCARQTCSCTAHPFQPHDQTPAYLLDAHGGPAELRRYASWSRGHRPSCGANTHNRRHVGHRLLADGRRVLQMSIEIGLRRVRGCRVLPGWARLIQTWVMSATGTASRRQAAAIASTVLAVLVAVVVTTRLASNSAEPDPASDGITLNTSSWDPDAEGAFWMEALVGGMVRVDPSGCVYLANTKAPGGRNVLWPAGYTASRQPDGMVIISDPDGVTVAAAGNILRVGGGAAAQFGDDLECAARGVNGDTFNGETVMITDELPPLNE
jgi:hypothetical protein